MKNIHILPTDKPSKLWFNLKGKLVVDTVNCLYEDIQCQDSSEADRLLGASKKIILTTDQDLIKDGVQAIDDEFLEWFVKNPSCQYGGYKNIDWDKIITQKEEPKQETLEEASERIYPTTIDSFTDNGFDLSERERLIFINGAEWQAERMYSKEDMEYAFKSSSLTNVLDVYESFEEFIGQYKKK